MSGPVIAVVNVFFAPNTYGGATVVAEEVSKCLLANHGATIHAISAISRADLSDYAVVRAQADGITSWLINLPGGRSYAERYTNPRVAGPAPGTSRGGF